MERQSWSRYWTLFWPKYWARAAGAGRVSAASTRATVTAPFHRRMRKSFPRPDPRGSPRRPAKTRVILHHNPAAGATTPAAGTLADGCAVPGRRCTLVFPARLEVDVELGRRGSGGEAGAGAAALGEAGGDVEEPVDPVLGLDVALEGVLDRGVGRRVGPREPGQLLRIADQELRAHLAAHLEEQLALPVEHAALLARQA